MKIKNKFNYIAIILIIIVNLSYQNKFYEITFNQINNITNKNPQNLEEIIITLKNLNSSNGFTNNQKLYFVDTQPQNISQNNNNTNSSIPNILPENKTVINTQFPGIQLYHQVPNNFLLNQFYRFSGKVSNFSVFSRGMQNIPSGYNYINIVFQDVKTNKTIRCQNSMDYSLGQFQVYCKLNQLGNFYISIFPGFSGSSSAKTRNITINNNNQNSSFLSQIPSLSSNLKTNVQNNKVYIQWFDLTPVSKIVFQQGINKKQFYLSNYWNKFQIPYQQFFQFKLNQQIQLSLSAFNSSDGSLFSRSSNQSQSKRFIIKPIQYKKYSQYTNITLQPQVPWVVPVGYTIDSSIITNQALRTQGYLVLPNGQVITITLSTTNGLRYKHKFTSEGTYIMAIYLTSGIAIINRPIYVTNSPQTTIPILPDYLSIKSNDLLYELAKKQIGITMAEPAKTSQINLRRTYIVQLLNALRRKYGLNNLQLNQVLSISAQQHGQDMSKYNYFGHTDRLGQGPADRVKVTANRLNSKQGTGSFGQNLARSSSLLLAHFGLQRSPSHLTNSLNKNWGRVGVGISQNSDGSINVVVVFGSRDVSKNPVTQSQLITGYSHLINTAIQRNTGITQNQKLTSLINQFLSNPPADGNLGNFLFSNGLNGSLSWTNFSIQYVQKWQQIMTNNANFLKTGSTKFKTIGIGLKVDQQGILRGIAVFN